ncbi:MAG: histidine--tRNA ligase [Gammaproteobacteria bacterium]|nr:histidine--tRNA ligase [Gammaproteobacteria bacterium]OUU11935.1 MAG: histidine--tRNA ligase [Gammaproteobacteria bacterium TMED34]
MKVKALRGMQDLLPEKQAIFRHITSRVGELLDTYGYRQIGLPLLESTHLFARLVGDSTEVVQKQMYTFEDKSGDDVTLRPEGTAGCVRAALEHGLTFNQVQRLWYAGPMFRYERPQKGRYRQFEQIGCECFGMAGPDIDAEMLLMLHRIWTSLGVTDDVNLELNTLGDTAARKRYSDALVDYFSPKSDQLDDDGRRLLKTNPLRILDSKHEGTKALLPDVPTLTTFVDDEARTHFDELRRNLDQMQVPYVVNPRIVRGLDYYNRTVFEWTTDTLGSQGTVCGGGRYDRLVEELGGRSAPAVGFAMGLDRLALMLENKFVPPAEADVFIVSEQVARPQALVVAEKLRNWRTGLRVVTHCGDGKFKSQFKKADASGAQVAVIIGESEIQAGTVTVKPLRGQSDQQTVNESDMADLLAQCLE